MSNLSSHVSGNLMGILSIAVWSSVIAFSRSLTEALGTFTSGASIYLAGGVISVGLMLLRHYVSTDDRVFEVTMSLYPANRFHYSVEMKLEYGNERSR